MFYTITGDESGVSTVFFTDDEGESYQATSESGNYAEIVRRVQAGDFDVAELFDVETAVTRRFERLTDRVLVSDETVLFDGEPVDPVVERQILRFLNEGVDDWKPLVGFLTKTAANPEPHSREQLMRWLAAADFSLTPEGDIVGYKGVAKDDKGGYVSINSGYAIVDGQEVNGRVPNYIGAVVEMPRADVQHDPSVGCHVGLHVGTFSYAQGFGRGVVLTVTVSPTDVVSVPTDCSDQKMRTCRYKVTGVTETAKTTPLVYDNDWESDDVDDYDYDYAY